MAETIFALSSAKGRAGVAVVRVSGPGAKAALGELAGGLPAPRQASLRTLRRGDEAIDRALVLWFPEPNSFTGEDVAEFHVHGGPAVVAALLRALGDRPGFAPAEPGEFTRRAFYNGRLDLTQVEGLADLIASETEAQRRQALRVSGGELTHAITAWRDRLLRTLALIEAGIDFPDEDVPDGMLSQMRPEMLAVRAAVAQAVAGAHAGEIVRDGATIAIIGPPNAGKSSLLNALAGRDAAIVSDLPGTTRDVVEVRLDLGGYVVVFADTAGLRETGDAIEVEGVRRARARAESADLRLAVLDAQNFPRFDSETVALLERGDWVLWNKQDLVNTPVDSDSIRNQNLKDGVQVAAISAKSGAGIDFLLRKLEAWLTRLMSGSESVTITRARHRQALLECGAALDRALSAGDAELAAEDLRLALRALGRIVGAVDVEDLLDVVFREFCIGK